MDTEQLNDVVSTVLSARLGPIFQFVVENEAPYCDFGVLVSSDDLNIRLEQPVEGSPYFPRMQPPEVDVSIPIDGVEENYTEEQLGQAIAEHLIDTYIDPAAPDGLVCVLLASRGWTVNESSPTSFIVSSRIAALYVKMK
jgi:hypothetical protein